jgi:hypothetical protein
LKKGAHGITIKIPRENAEGESTYEKVKSHVESNPDYAYTRTGLLVEIYKYNPEELNKPFDKWPKGAPTQYTRVRVALEKLEKEGLVTSKRHGKKFLYWWTKSP